MAVISIDMIMFSRFAEGCDMTPVTSGGLPAADPEPTAVQRGVDDFMAAAVRSETFRAG